MFMGYGVAVLHGPGPGVHVGVADRLGIDADRPIVRSFLPAAPGALNAFNPLGTGAALKPAANKIAETDISARASVIRNAEARTELFCFFFMRFLGGAKPWPPCTEVKCDW